LAGIAAHLYARQAKKPPGETMRTILLVILVLLLLGALPTWPYSSGWGYYPSGGLGLVLLIVVVLALTGRL
jgi:polyferredoxin